MFNRGIKTILHHLSDREMMELKVKLHQGSPDGVVNKGRFDKVVVSVNSEGNSVIFEFDLI